MFGPSIRASLQGILAEANQAVGRLDGMTSAFPDLNPFLYSYVRKEAVLSSQIQATQSSLSDLPLYENSEILGVPLDDVQEVFNYVAALNHGHKRLRGGFPLSLHLIREIQRSIAGKGPWKSRSARQVRKSQNSLRNLCSGVGSLARNSIGLVEIRGVSKRTKKPFILTVEQYRAATDQQDYIRAAGRRAKLGEGYWIAHLPHSYRAFLDECAAPVGVEQKLMRHAQVAPTMNVYGNVHMHSKRSAYSKVVQDGLA